MGPSDLCLFHLQDLQRDIEQHTESVASVLTLCDVLLHDADACGSDTENDSIQLTTRSLDRRWRNICAMSMERRMRWDITDHKVKLDRGTNALFC